MKPRLVIYDFDGTLYNSPTREIGEDLYFEATGSFWPFAGWYGRPETLRPPIVADWNALWIPHVVAACQEDLKRDDTLTVLMTGRPYKMHHLIKEILSLKALVFPQYYFRGMKGIKQFGDTFDMKLNVIKTELIHEGLKLIEIWEDRPEHKSKFCEAAKRWKIKTIIRDVPTGEVLTFN